MKKIALVSHSSHLHGAERMLLNLALLLRDQQDYHPILILPGRGDFSEVALVNGLQCIFTRDLPWYVYGSTATYFHDVQTSADSVKNILINIGVDIVIVNTLTSISPVLATVRLNIPVIVWVHGVIDASMVGPRDSQFVYWNEIFLLQTASAIVANSNWTATFYREILDVRGIRVIPNWTEVEPSLLVDEGKYQSRTIVCLNTIEKNKGHEVLMEAARSLKQKHLDFRLELYGDGPDQTKIRKMCRKYDLESNVKFMGITKDPRQVYDRASVVVNPSYIESFGMTLIEAMARKTPVIATRSGGPQDIIVHGDSGYLVGRGDADGLTKYIEALIEDPQQARQMGEKAYLRVQDRFSTQAVSADFLALIDSAIQNHKVYDPHIMHELFLFDWLSKGISSAGGGKIPANSFFVGSTLAARSTVRLVRMLEYNIHSQFPLWAGFEFMIGTNNESVAGIIKIEVFDQTDGDVVQRKVLDLKTIQDNQTILVEFDRVRTDSEKKAYTIRFVYKPYGRKSVISVYESNDQEIRVKRILRRIGLLTRGNTLACRLLYIET